MTTIIKNTLAGLLITTGMLTAQNKQERKLDDFTAIKASGGCTVYLIQGTPQQVTISAEEGGDLASLQTEVQNGVLTISGGKALNETRIDITIPKLNGITADGAVNIKSTGEIKTEELSLAGKGASMIKLQVDAQSIKVDGDGASMFKLTGKTEKLDATLSGAASLKSDELEAKDAKVNASGAASVKINPINKVVVDASGASSVRMVNEPADKTINVNGASTVKKSKKSGGDSTGDTTSFKISGKKLMIVDENLNDSISKNDRDRILGHGKHRKNKNKKHSLDEYAHWTGIDIGVNGLLNAQNTLSAPKGYEYTELNYGKSISVAWNIFDINLPIFRPYAQLVTGMGLEWNGYNFRNPITLNPNSSTVMVSYDSTSTFRKNKLKQTWLNIPLLLQLNFGKNPDKAIHLAGGVTLGYQLGSKTKQVYDNNGYEVVAKRSDDYLLAPFRASATVRAGVGDFTLFANYALTELFEKGKGPQLYPFSVGLNIGF